MYIDYMEEMLPIHRTIDYLFKLLVLKGSRFSFAEHKILNLLFIFGGLLPIFFSLTVFRLFKTLKKMFSSNIYLLTRNLCWSFHRDIKFCCWDMNFAVMEFSFLYYLCGFPLLFFIFFSLSPQVWQIMLC